MRLPGKFMTLIDERVSTLPRHDLISCSDFGCDIDCDNDGPAAIDQ